MKHAAAKSRGRWPDAPVKRAAPKVKTIKELTAFCGKSFPELWPYLCGRQCKDVALVKRISDALAIPANSLAFDAPRRRRVLYGGVLELICNTSGVNKRTVYMLLLGRTNARKDTAAKLEKATGIPAENWRNDKVNYLSMIYCERYKAVQALRATPKNRKGE